MQSGMLDAGCSMLDARFWMLDARLPRRRSGSERSGDPEAVGNAGCWMLDTRYSMLDARLPRRSRGCWVLACPDAGGVGAERRSRGSRDRSGAEIPRQAGILDAGCWMLDARLPRRSRGCWMLACPDGVGDAGCWLLACPDGVGDAGCCLAAAGVSRDFHYCSFKDWMTGCYPGCNS
ncbi:MAG: hypothetical protein D6681_17560 [Calditrichaeota bacterium]|nr:MAG: hypothetical protein D6681_17560 [Calditrichota bacterium]